MIKMVAFAVAALGALLFATTAWASQGWTACTEQWVVSGWYPSEVAGGVRVCRDGVIATSYDVKMINPAFSAYYVTKQRVSKLVPGRDSFVLDPDLKAMGVTQAAVNSDAFNTSWNRGHLAPSHIMSWTAATKKATFTMSNVAPQGARFNQQPWVALEESVLNYILSSGNSLHIVTGVAYTNRAKARRTFDNIAVPDYYWKVLCDAENAQSVGFFGVNDDVNDPSCKSPVTVAEVEALYGGAIFPSVCNPSKLDKTHWWF